jgi:hypothetical protein
MQSHHKSISAAVKVRAHRRGFKHAVAKMIGCLKSAGAVRHRHLKAIEDWQLAVNKWSASTSTATMRDPPPWLDLRGKPNSPARKEEAQQ